MIKRLLWFILSIIVAAILFILIIFIFPSRRKSVDILNMTYILIDDDWIEYDIFEPVHGAARDWSFLFKNNNMEDSSQSWLNDEIHDNTWNNILWNIDYIWEMEIKSWDNTKMEQDLSNMDPNNLYDLPEWAIEKPVFKDCETPRWITIRHGESILAYQQRRDVPEICNVQKRTCNNWVLDGNFTQPSCNETVIYRDSNSYQQNITTESNNVVSYTKKQVVSHNDTSVKSELVQTPKYAKNELAEYDKNWKIKKWGTQPKTDWDNNDNELFVWDYSSVEQKNIKHYNCQSPWWEIVQHGQFIRAYELPYWFTNASCKIELRLCVDWELKWSYTYQDCQYLDITYEEYNNISEINSWNEIINYDNTYEERWFWAWILDLFR